MRSLAKWALLSMFVIIAGAGCASTSLSRSAMSPMPAAVSPSVGIASYYGRQYQGRKTASGEIYNMHALTAAHRTLPFGTELKVTNLANNKAVLVRVNDRGPFVHDRIVDLSYEAARQLGILVNGIGTVRLEAMETLSSTRRTSDLSPPEMAAKQAEP